MTALPSTGPAAWSSPGNPLPRLEVWCGGFAGGAACCCGGVLVARRLAGAFSSAPGGWQLAAATAVGVGLVLVADHSARGSGRRAAAWAARIGLVATVAALVTVPRATPAAWFLPAVAVGVAGLAVLPRFGPPRARPLVRRPPPGRTPPAADRGPVTPRLRPIDPPTDGRLQQRLERFDDPSGVDTLRGRLVLVVPAGAKSAHGHMGFCPAFVRTPQVTVTTDYDGVEATLTAAEVLPWGVRVECRLAEPADEPVEIPVDLFVRTAT